MGLGDEVLVDKVVDDRGQVYIKQIHQHMKEKQGKAPIIGGNRQKHGDEDGQDRFSASFTISQGFTLSIGIGWCPLLYQYPALL